MIYPKERCATQHADSSLILVSFGGALHRSSSGPCANWPRATQPEMIGSSTPEGACMFFNGPVVGGDRSER